MKTIAVALLLSSSLFAAPRTLLDCQGIKLLVDEEGHWVHGVAMTTFAVVDVDGTTYEPTVELHSEGADISVPDFRGGDGLDFGTDFDEAGEESFFAYVGQQRIECSVFR